jgi:phospholipid transport system transporter-binding protein
MFRFDGPITMDNASAALTAARRGIDDGRGDDGGGDDGEVEFALDALVHSDSSAVAVLIAAQRHAEMAGKTLRWSAVPDAVRSLARLYGVDALIAGSPSDDPRHAG